MSLVVELVWTARAKVIRVVHLEVVESLQVLSALSRRLHVF